MSLDISLSGDGPAPFAGYRCAIWKGKAFWFRPHERPWVRCLFLAAALGGGIPAADLPQSLRLESDAYGDLIIETAGIATLAARPRLAGRGVPPAG